MQSKVRSAVALASAATCALCGCASMHVAEWEDPLYQRVLEGWHQFEDDSDSFESIDQTRPGTAPDPDVALSLPVAVRTGLLNHPSLKQAGFAVRASAMRQHQAGLAPNPAVGLEFEALGSDAGEGGETKLWLEQEITTAGKQRKARDLAEADRLTEQASFRGAVFEASTRIRIAYVAACAAEQRLDAFESLLAVAEELLAAADARVEAGAAAEPDRLRAQVVREQAALDASSARASLSAARRVLAAAMGVEGTIEASLAGDLAALPVLPGEDEVLTLALQHNSEIERARIAIERATRAHALAKADATPNFFAAAGPRYSDLDNETTLDIGLGVEIPLLDRNQGEVGARMAERLAAGAALGLTRLQLIEATTIAWAAYETSRTSVEAYTTSLLPKAERTLELTREAYRVGKSDYLRLLDAQQTLVRARIASIDALESLHEAAAELEGLMQRIEPWQELSDAGKTEETS